MDAEHAGEDGGGQFGGELEQGGGAGWLAWIPSWCSRSADPVGAEGLPGLAAGEQPWRVVVAADGGVAASGGDEFADESGEWFGEQDRFSAEPEPDLSVADLDVVDGESG